MTASKDMWNRRGRSVRELWRRYDELAERADAFLVWLEEQPEWQQRMQQEWICTACGGSDGILSTVSNLIVICDVHRSYCTVGLSHRPADRKALRVLGLRRMKRGEEAKTYSLGSFVPRRGVTP